MTGFVGFFVGLCKINMQSCLTRFSDLCIYLPFHRLEPKMAMDLSEKPTIPDFIHFLDNFRGIVKGGLLVYRKKVPKTKVMISRYYKSNVNDIACRPMV